MSDKGNSVEWVETTEEVVIIEECLPPDDNNHTGIANVLFSAFLHNHNITKS